MLIDHSALAAVLHYGAPVHAQATLPTLPFDIETLEIAHERRRSSTQDKSALLAEGARLWKAACRRAVDRASRKILLPLSAGLDSRAILAGLRACDAPIHTVTYGLPGALDYEIAPRVAACAGATHDRIDLEAVDVSRTALLDVMRGAALPSSALDMFYNAQIPKRYKNDYSYINGFAGDALAGNNLGKAHGATWPQATATFAKWHRASKTVKLTANDMDPDAALPQAPIVDIDLLSPVEQLDYAIRQQRMVRPIVCPPDVEVLTPFLDSEWCAFILGLPAYLRADRAFFIELFQYSDPELFSLPTTASGGMPLGSSPEAIRQHLKRLRRRRRRWLRLSRIMPSIRVPPSDRRWQYLDFRTCLREDGDLAAIFADAMRRIDERGITPWIDASSLLRAHRAEQDDHFKALNVLLNLDLLLEARPELLELPGA